MKTVVETHFIKKHFSEAETYKQIKQAGFDAADLSFYYGSIKLDENYLSAAKETRRLLDEVGLPCVQAHAQFYSDQNPGFQYGMNMDVSEPAFLELTRAIEYAAIAGAKNIVCHSITVPEGGQTGACLEYNYKFFKALAPYAKQFGINCTAVMLADMSDDAADREANRISRTRGEMLGVVTVSEPEDVDRIDETLERILKGER
jgi:sugar phosphate isomerase/epimerase